MAIRILPKLRIFARFAIPLLPAHAAVKYERIAEAIDPGTIEVPAFLVAGIGLIVVGLTGRNRSRE